jgi:hypothetical protein
MSRFVRVLLALAFLPVLALPSGCGSGSQGLSPAEAQEDSRRGMMREIGEMLTLYKASNNKAPASVADVAKYEVGFQIGYLRLKDGTAVVLWGAPLQEGAADTIIAYEKVAPETGGYVLMQDGTTVKKLTAEEFKAAPKAPGTATADAKK